MDETMVTAETMPSEHNEPQAKVTPNECEESHLQEETFCLPVKFNKQDYQLSKDEATAYAQKGMKFDTIEPMLHKLKNLAQQNGTSLGDLVDALCAPAQPTEQVSVEERLAEETEPVFDIMQLLAAEAEKLANVSPIDMMETYGELVIEITLEELVQYNNAQRSKRRMR